MTIAVLLVLLGTVGVAWIGSWLGSTTGSPPEIKTGHGGSLPSQIDEQSKIWNEKWHQKFQEQEARGFTTGTIDEFLAEKGRDFGILERTPSRLVFTSPRYPDDVFVLFQVRSVQGRDILLGTARIPALHKGGKKTDLAEWTIHDPDVEFDETKHYSRYYQDEWNNAYMFAIWKKVPGGEDLPIQALFYPRRVKVPNLASERANLDLYRDRHKGRSGNPKDILQLPENIRKVFSQ